MANKDFPKQHLFHQKTHFTLIFPISSFPAVAQPDLHAVAAAGRRDRG